MNRQPWHTDEYVDYLDSDEWEHKRKLKLALVHRCELYDDVRYTPDGIEVRQCKGPLHVHHKTYNNLGSEKLDDLSVLCEHHHKELHTHQSTRRRSEARYDSAFDTWMTKRTGSESWETFTDVYEEEDERERFDEWLETQERW